MMAEINRDVLRSIILDVLQEMGGVHEAPQFKASVGESTTPSAIFKLIQKLITQFGSSTSKRTISNNTNIAIKTSLKFVPFAPCC